MSEHTPPSAGGHLVPSWALTGRWVDASGPIRRLLARLGLVQPRMEWQPGPLEATRPRSAQEPTLKGE